MLISLKDIREIVDMLRSKLKGVVEEAYLFGSIVEGCAVVGESDLDLLIVPGNKKVDYFSLLGDVVEKLLDLGVVLHIHVADNVTYKHLLKHVRSNAIRIA